MYFLKRPSMINLKELITEEIHKVSLQMAIDKKFFGPVYHGTSAEKRDKIAMDGFKIPVGHERSGDISHGYESSNYSGGIPAPIHHFGFGVYLTTSKAIAKRFAGGTVTGMKAYFIDAPRMETINFGSPNTMMKWWLANGYDYKVTPETTFGNSKTNVSEIRNERLRATKNLTKELSSRYEAVWYKGKGMYKLLDGDQICVFNPSNIYMVDKSLIKPGEIGSKVIAKIDIDPYNNGNIVVPKGTIGILTHKEKPNELQKWAAGSNYIYHVKFVKGREQCNLTDKHIEPYIK